MIKEYVGELIDDGCSVEAAIEFVVTGLRDALAERGVVMISHVEDTGSPDPKTTH